MRNTKPLDALLPKTRQGILAALLVQPEKTWYVSELARRMGVPSSSLQRELLDLTVDRVRQLPVLLVITFRPEFQPPWGGC